MDIREITPRYYVAPQIDAKDLSELKAQGFTCVICNRPDEEVLRLTMRLRWRKPRKT